MCSEITIDFIVTLGAFVVGWWIMQPFQRTPARRYGRRWNDREKEE